ncbi:hypothetical protein [Paraburkholderia sp. BR14374]|uniref:hypothetical protein n=1 Tax=Paraburkholderia sp. BR14374 TaxID=3237007 RepID=UPI0034CE0D99
MPIRNGASPRALMMKGGANCSAAVAAVALSMVRRLKAGTRPGVFIGFSLTVMSNLSNRRMVCPRVRNARYSILNAFNGIHKTPFSRYRMRDRACVWLPYDFRLEANLLQFADAMRAIKLAGVCRAVDRQGAAN